MSRQLDMFDGRGYFMLFEGSTGEVLVPPTGETKTPVFIGTSLYDFLDRASQYSEPASTPMPRSQPKLPCSSCSRARGATFPRCATLWRTSRRGCSRPR